MFVEQLDDVPATLKEIVQDGDIVLTMGAGNVGALATTLMDKLGERK